MKKKLRVLVLVREGLEPPDTIEGLSEDEYKGAIWKCEFDVTATLREMGHAIRILPVYDDLVVIRKTVEEWKPHVAFNLLEEFRGVALYDHNVVTYLELLGARYTGCNPRGLMIARDKALSKKLLTYHRIRVPRFSVFPLGRRKFQTRRLEFPLFVKSAMEDSSIAVSQASLVKDEGGLHERVGFVHEQTGADVIAEEFIQGRELYVGVLGNLRLETFPIWELLFENLPDDAPLIATRRAKWNRDYQKKWGVKTREAEGLSEPMVREIHKKCRRIYRILGLSGYARMDFRLNQDGKLYFLEANPNPDISFGEDFAESAQKKGVLYETLLRRVMALGMRWKPTQLE